MEYTFLNHPIPPVYDQDSKILILGSFPSVKSRKYDFFYMNPQNRFWKVLSDLLADDFLVKKEEKISLLLKHHIALWDVIESCEIKGSSDSSIRNVKVNPISELLSQTGIQAIFFNGKKSFQLYEKHISLDFPVYCLPSTSPANGGNYSYDALKDAWRLILPYLK